MTIGSAGYAKFRVSSKKTVVVTHDLISDAQRQNSGHCMVAEAVKALMPDMRNISVDLQSIRWSDRKKGLRYVALTPRIAQVALIKWDQGEIPDPFNFQLRGVIVVQMQRRSKAEKERAQVRRDKDLLNKIKEGKGRKKQNRAFIDVKKNGPRSVKTVRVGGKAPPKTGLRRAFGLRAYTP